MGDDVIARVTQSATIGQLAGALSKAQGVFVNPPKNRTVEVQTTKGGKYKFRYATYDAILDATRAPLAEHGLAVFQTIQNGEGKYRLVTTLCHESGEWVSSETPLLVQGHGNQEFGSALTYMRRYAYCALLGIAADEDDDANAADGNTVKQSAQRPAKAAAKQASEKAEASRPKAVNGDPQVIPVPVTEDGKGSDWRLWTKQFVTTLEAQTDLTVFETWIRENAKATGKLKDQKPQIHDWLIERIEKQRAYLSQAPQEEAA